MYKIRVKHVMLVGIGVILFGIIVRLRSSLVVIMIFEDDSMVQRRTFVGHERKQRKELGFQGFGD